MSLLRVTFAIETIASFIEMPPSQQRTLIYLLSRRNMRRRPIRPTAYLSFDNIAENTDLKPRTVENCIRNLQNDNWIREQGRRKIDGVMSYSWDIHRVREEVDKAFEQEELDIQSEEAAQPEIFIAENGNAWREGGNSGYQMRLAGKQIWYERYEIPEEVLAYFEAV